jgi:hypothetical protein
MKKLPNNAKTPAQFDLDEILPEYNFSCGSRNKYASRYAAGSTVVVIEPDVEANDAPRAPALLIQKHRPKKPCSRRSRS